MIPVESGQQRVQVSTGRAEWKAAQAIVAAEFNNHDVWMYRKQGI